MEARKKKVRIKIVTEFREKGPSKSASAPIAKLTITSHRLQTLPLPACLELILTRTLAILLDKEMVRVLRVLNMPGDIKLVSLRSASAAARQALGRRAVDREREEVLRLRVVGDEAGAQEEVDEAEDVGGEDEHEHGVEDPLPLLENAGCVFLRRDGCVEGEVDAWVECVRGVVPEVVVGCSFCAQKQCVADHHG